MQGRLEPFGNLAFIDCSCFGRSFCDYICWVDSRLLVLSRLAMCRFELAVVISNLIVVLIRMQTIFAVVVSGFGLNVKQQTYSSGTCAT